MIVPKKIKPGSIEVEAPWYDDNPDDRVDAGRAQMMFDEEGSFKHTRDAVIEGKPYPIKGWLTYKTNPMQTGANRNKTIEMIHKLDFMVTIDITNKPGELSKITKKFGEEQININYVYGSVSDSNGNCLFVLDRLVTKDN